MPEGPEIRLAADKIADVLVHKEISSVYFAFDTLKRYEARLTGRQVIAIETYGKAMLTRFDNRLNIYSHNQLYGVWKIFPKDKIPQTKRVLRLALVTATHAAHLYSASDIEVLEDPEVEYHPFIRKIGPDALNPALTVAEIEHRFMADRFKRRRLATLLLDQSFLAGIGNYLRTEILYVAQVGPTRRPVDCTPAEIRALSKAALDLTRQSYRTKGVTNDLSLVETLKKEGKSRAQYRFWAFNRDEKPCYRCGTPIIKEAHGSRRLYRCPQCQI